MILAGTPAASDAPFSTVHGAGGMSRTKAAGKSRRRWTCPNPACDWFQGPGEHVTPPRQPEELECPKCGHLGLTRRMQQLTPGLIDFGAIRAQLTDQRVELRGGAADEAPGAYKRLNDVLAAQGDTIQILHRPRPIGVAMAAPDTNDHSETDPTGEPVVAAGSSCTPPRTRP